jgi:molecular chaperone DnaJ
VVFLAQAKRDYYEVLGLSKNCSPIEVKTAYRKLARKYHPDVNNGDSGAEDKFKEISEAYAVLSNDEKRHQYDTYGFNGSLFDGINFDSVFSEFGFGDIFNMFFGNTFGSGFGSGRAGRRGKARGTDTVAEASIEFKEAAFGVKKEVHYSVNVNCDECNGKKTKSIDGIITCMVCHGTGQIRKSRDTFLGSLVTTAQCDNCNGTGIIIKDPCDGCGGKGYVNRKKTINVDIPSGVSNLDKLRVTGQGNSLGADSIAGDLILTIRVNPHPEFRRDGDDIITVMDISFAQAALGTEISIETLDGYEELDIKPGTQPGTKILLKSKGIVPLHGGRRGDHIIFINIKIPTNLKPGEIEILRKYAEGRNENVGDGQNGFFSNLKKVFKN